MTRKFPKEELFVLTSQFRRAADSVVLNIAEGARNNSKKEFGKFLSYSIRSGYECLGCLDIVLTEQYLEQHHHDTVSKEVDEIVSMLVGLQRSLIKCVCTLDSWLKSRIIFLENKLTHVTQTGIFDRLCQIHCKLISPSPFLYVEKRNLKGLSSAAT
jgi:four helix bundle protein